jgi:hypothetical protein
LWFKTCDYARRNGVANEVFDPANFMTLAVDSQGKGCAIATGTTRPTNAVDVIFGLHGQVVVDGVADGLNVNTACGNVSGDQDTDTAVLNFRQSA